MFSKSVYRPKTATAQRLSSKGVHKVSDRQELIPGFSQKALSKSTGIVIGAGGIGSAICYGFARKGIGELKIFDHDLVESTNLNRQFFLKKDLGKNKAEVLAVNLSKNSFNGTRLFGYSQSFQDTLALNIDLSGQFAVCGVDNGQTRTDASIFFREKEIPIIFVAVDLSAEYGYCFVQESKPGRPCFGCKFPRTYKSEPAPCRAPASIDVLQTLSGFALYAIDSILMERQRAWNYREIHLAGFMPDANIKVELNPDCPLCGVEEMQNRTSNVIST